ncbi:MAG: cupin domain-containing protein [Chloroflexi bacterium]|nr:cupin domain-containing protein [Chloroflexota bacterium]
MGKVDCPAEWKPHPHFPRVFLKPLITSEINPELTLSLVRLEPGGEIPPHTHAQSTETVYVLSGRGMCRIGSEEFNLEPGVCCYAPPDMTHLVCNTGDSVLEAISIFNPPLT